MKNTQNYDIIYMVYTERAVVNLKKYLNNSSITQKVFMPHEDQLTTYLLEKLQGGDITKIARSARRKTVEFRREVGNNSFFTDILISLFPKEGRGNFFDYRKTQFIAIEVKISNWKQGLYQAWKYSSFAEKSYLALHKDYAKDVVIDLFEKYNVGLIILDESDEKGIKILHHPISNSFVKNGYESKLREKIWQRSLSIQSIQPVF